MCSRCQSYLHGDGAWWIGADSVNYYSWKNGQWHLVGRGISDYDRMEAARKAHEAAELAAAAKRLATRGKRPPQPEPRMVRSAAEAEELCAEWIRWMGFADADVTVAGADGGLDVVGSNETGTIAAQVKFEAVSAGRPKVQALYGAGMAAGASIFAFFSSAGYTQQAEQWASGVGMALFGFALDGSIVATNEVAEHLMDG